jgi:hypothetical protein
VSGEVLVVFDIEAQKSGVTKYNYITRGQWASERLNSRGEYINATKATYMDGSIILIDGDSEAIDNYTSRPVWRLSN